MSNRPRRKAGVYESREAFLDSLHYDPDTGIFTREDGYEAHNNGAKGYLVLMCSTISGRTTITAQRAAFYKMTGRLPVGVVDHINGVKRDNRWVNLRDVSQELNSCNVFVRTTRLSARMEGKYFPVIGPGFDTQEEAALVAEALSTMFA